MCRLVEPFKLSYWAPGAEALLAELTLRLHGLCKVVEPFKLSYWAPRAEALLVELPELN